MIPKDGLHQCVKAGLKTRMENTYSYGLYSKKGFLLL